MNAINIMHEISSLRVEESEKLECLKLKRNILNIWNSISTLEWMNFSRFRTYKQQTLKFSKTKKP